MTCYLRNGTKAKRALPCNHTAIIEGKHTSCCDPESLCLTNGLCRDPFANEMTNFAWFFGCTDKTFKDPSCGNYCDKVNREINNQLSFQCPQHDTWCCNTGEPPPQADRMNRTNTTCCSMKDLLFTAPGPIVYTTPLYSGTPFSVGTLLSPSAAATLSRYSSGSPAITSAQSTNTLSDPVASEQAGIAVAPQSKSPLLAIGLGAGLGTFAVIALILGAFLIWRRRGRNQHSASELPSDDRIELTGQEIAEITEGKERYELRSDSNPRFEMMADADVDRAELPADAKNLYWPELSAGGGDVKEKEDQKS